MIDAGGFTLLGFAELGSSGPSVGVPFETSLLLYPLPLFIKLNSFCKPFFQSARSVLRIVDSLEESWIEGFSIEKL